MEQPRDTEKERLRATLSRYAKGDDRSGMLQLLNTIPIYLALWAAMAWVYPYSLVATLALSIPTGLFLVRIFSLQHDCGHFSLFRTRWINDWVGCLLSLFTWTPFYNWRFVHNRHHATSGDLDRRSQGDIWTMTVDEYRCAGTLRRIHYRIFRNPILLFLTGPSLYFLIRRRFPVHLKKDMKREIRNVYLTNLALIALYGALALLVGPALFLSLLIPVVVVGSSVGVWFFYVQHTYPEAYWSRSDRWNHVDAGILGSSYYALPTWLNWFTADIAVHHIHHVDSRIPNYRLRRCMEENPELRPKVVITLRESLQLTKLKLWDERRQRLVGFEL